LPVCSRSDDMLAGYGTTWCSRRMSAAAPAPRPRGRGSAEVTTVQKVWQPNQKWPGDAKAPSVCANQAVRHVADLGFSAADRTGLVRLLALPEKVIGARPVDEACPALGVIARELRVPEQGPVPSGPSAASCASSGGLPRSHAPAPRTSCSRWSAWSEARCTRSRGCWGSTGRSPAFTTDSLIPGSPPTRSGSDAAL